jgi:hypothetical protein
MKSLNFWLITLSFFFLFNGISIAQIEFQKKNHQLTLDVYSDLYFGLESTGAKKNAAFLYNHKFNNKVSNNLTLLSLGYKSRYFHSNVKLMAGDYSRFNLAHEPRWMRALNECYVGFKPFKRTNLWIDAGVYASYIGLEGAMQFDCPTLSRSMLAENSPYYLSGIRSKWTSKDEKTELGIHLLNGWQRINFDTSYAFPNYGFEFKSKHLKNVTLGYGLFVGSIYPKSDSILRHYHNITCVTKIKSWTLFTTLDIGFQKNNMFFGTVVNLQRKWTDKISSTIRLEYYADPTSQNISWQGYNDFQVSGFSINLDYYLKENILVRIEPKLYYSKNKGFDGENFNLSGLSTICFKL